MEKRYHHIGRWDTFLQYTRREAKMIAKIKLLSRLYGRILKHFLEAGYKVMRAEEQAGFKVGRSTIDLSLIHI